MNDDTIRNHVLYILSKYPTTRKYDNLLDLRFLIKIGFAWRRGDRIIIDMSKAEEFPSFASIERVRRKIQNDEGLYKPDEETQEKREKSRGEFKEKYSNKERSVDEMPNSQLMY